MNLKLHRSVGYSEQEIQSLSNLSDSLLFELLEAQESFVNNTLKLSKDMLNELALVTAEFFEDIILDIGIWRSLEDYGDDPLLREQRQVTINLGFKTLPIFP